MTIKKKIIIFVFGLVLAGGLASGAPSVHAAKAGASLEKVILQLKWFHQFQFAGYYAAVEQGYFRDAGLQVEILEGGPFDAVEKVLSSEARYGVSSTEVMLGRFDGEPVVVLAAVFQHSPLAFMIRDGSGIHHPQDLAGQRVWMGLEPRSAELHAMLLDEGIALDRIDIIGDVADSYDFLWDESISAFGVYVTNEPFYLERQGIPITLIRPAAYGIDFYGDCLFTSEQELKNHPDRVRRFRDAALKGWEYAMAHPDEIIELILARYGSTNTREHLQYEAEKTRELILPDLVEIGQMNPGRWRHIADTYARLGMIEPDYSLEGFLYNPHPKPDHTRLYWFLIITGVLLAAFACLAGILALFNRRLGSAVRMRTTELQRRNEDLVREIDRREEAEKQVRFQGRLLDSVGQSVIATDLEGIILYANRAAETQYGWPADGLKGQNVTTVIVPTSGRNRAEEIMSLLQRGKTWSGEFIVQRRDGTEFTAHVTNSPVTNNQGELEAIIGVSTDISEVKRVEKSLRESRRSLYKLMENIQAGIVVHGKDGKILECNSKATELLGLHRNQLLGIGHTDPRWRIVREDGESMAPEEFPVMKVISEKRAIRDFVLGLCREDREEPVWLLVSGIPEFDKQGDISRVINTFMDISGRKKTTKALRESENRFRNQFESTPIPTFIWRCKDQKLHLIDCNTAADKLTSGNSKRFIGMSVEQIYPDRADLLDKFHTCLKGEKVIVYETDYLSRGTGLDRVIVFTFVHISPEIVMLHAEDITERKQAESQLQEYSEQLAEMVEERTRELKNAQEELLIRERLAVLGHFAGSVSHELRNPLGAVDASVYYLKMKMGGRDEKIEEHLKRIHANIGKATAIIESLLNLSRMEKPKTRPHSVRRLIPDILGAARVPETIWTETIDPKDKISINVDADQIRMALKNIIKNAVQAMEGTGTLTVEIRHSEAGGIEIRVSDSGPGISPENREKIFQPLFSTKTHGIGFGLSITKMIIENHGGTIRAESEPGKGAVFILTLPGIERRERTS